mgnify:CR=1 FL=1
MNQENDPLPKIDPGLTRKIGDSISARIRYFGFFSSRIFSLAPLHTLRRLDHEGDNN